MIYCKNNKLHGIIYTVAEQGVLPLRAKYIYGHPYWCSRNTFASKIAAPVKVQPRVTVPLVPPLLCH